MKKPGDYFDRLITRLESLPLSPLAAVGTLISIILLRNVLEGLLEEKHLIGLHESLSISLIDFFLQNTLFFVGLYLSLSLVIHLVSGERLATVSRILLTTYPIILIVPLVDFIVSGGAGYYLGYPVTPSTARDIIVHFFDPRVRLEGISIGLRLEVFIACWCVAIYTWRKSRSVWRTLVAPLTLYLTVLFHGFFPFLTGIIVKVVFQLPGAFSALEETFTDIFFRGEIMPFAGLRLSLLWLFWIAYLLLLWFFRHDRRLFSHWFDQVRNIRMVLFPLHVLLGVGLSALIIRVPAEYTLAHPFGVLSIVAVIIAAMVGGILVEELRGRVFPGQAEMLHSSTNPDAIVYAGEQVPASEPVSRVETPASTVSADVIVYHTIMTPSLGYLLLFVQCYLIVSLLALVNPALLIPGFALASLYGVLLLNPFRLWHFEAARFVVETLAFFLLLLVGAFCIGGVRVPLIISPSLYVVMIVLSTSSSLAIGFAARAAERSHSRFILSGGFVLSLLVMAVVLPRIPLLLFIGMIIMIAVWSVVRQRNLSWFPAVSVVLIWIIFFSLTWSEPDTWQRHAGEYLRHEKLLEARANFDRGKYYPAIDQYRQILAMDAAAVRTTVPLELGIACLKVHEPARAIDAFQHVLSHSPFSRDALMGMAIAWEQLGELPRALHIYQKLIDKGRATPKVRLMYALALSQAGSWQEALDQLDTVREFEESMPRLLLHRGDILVELQRYDEARTSYERLMALSADPKARRLAESRLAVVEKLLSVPPEHRNPALPAEDESSGPHDPGR